MTNTDHLSNDLLLKVIDDELPHERALLAGSHLSECAACRRTYEEFLKLSSRIETLIADALPESSFRERESLRSALEARDSRARSPQKAFRRFGWAMGIAATLAIGVVLAPRKNIVEPRAPVASVSPSTATFEVDGETFVAVPYSNADLPLAAPNIVQMRVPAESLAAVGIPVAPISNQSLTGDGSVLADVLLGTDGQPMGVHVIELE